MQNVKVVVYAEQITGRSFLLREKGGGNGDRREFL